METGGKRKRRRFVRHCNILISKSYSAETELQSKRKKETRNRRCVCKWNEHITQGETGYRCRNLLI